MSWWLISEDFSLASICENFIDEYRKLMHAVCIFLFGACGLKQGLETSELLQNRQTFLFLLHSLSVDVLDIMISLVPGSYFELFSIFIGRSFHLSEKPSEIVFAWRSNCPWNHVWSFILLVLFSLHMSIIRDFFSRYLGVYLEIR